MSGDYKLCCNNCCNCMTEECTCGNEHAFCTYWNTWTHGIHDEPKGVEDVDEWCQGFIVLPEPVE